MKLLYNIDFELAAAFYMIILYIYLRLEYSRMSERNLRFQQLTLLVLFVDIMDILTSITISYAKVIPLAVNVILNTVYFGSVAYFEYRFMNYITSYICPKRKQLHKNLVNNAICTLYILCLLLNLFCGYIFSFDNEGNYIHGIFYPIVFLIPIFYILYAGIIFIRNFSSFNRIQKVCVGSFVILGILGPAAQMLFFPDVLLSIFTFTFVILFMQFSLETPDYQKLIKTMNELDCLQKSLKQEVKKQTAAAEERREKVERLSEQVMRTLSGAIDAKDKYTNGHSMRVAEYSMEIARRLGKSEKEQKDIYYMGLLHDIGKIGISDNIISKTSKLTDDEYQIIRSHPIIGADILKNISEIPEIVTGARWHHERYDGKGYPDGLAGDAIPEPARIIGIADAYDAMASKRSYRDVLPQNVVREEIAKGRGTQFDPVITDVMLKMIDEDTEYKLREKS